MLPFLLGHLIDILVIWPIPIPVGRWYRVLCSRRRRRRRLGHDHSNNSVQLRSRSSQSDTAVNIETPESDPDPDPDPSDPEKALGVETHHDRTIWLGLETAPVIGFLLLLASTCIPGSVVRDGIVGNGGIKPYDILTLFLSFAYISISLDSTGLLRYLAFKVANSSGKSGRTLYFGFYTFFAILGLIVGNDPIILSGTPFLVYFTGHAGIADSTAYLFTEFQTSNLVSALLVSSNPTNLVLTSAFGISFLGYSAWLALPVVAGVVTLFPVLRWGLFRSEKLLPKVLDPPKTRARDALVDPFGAIFGAVLFGLTIILLIGLSAGGKLEGVEGVWTITAPAAICMLLRDIIYDVVRQKATETETSPSATTAGKGKESWWLTRRFPTPCRIISKLPLPLIPFAFSMFILVEALNYTGWIRVFAVWWTAWEKVGGVAGSVWLMGVLGVLGCNVSQFLSWAIQGT